MLKKLGYKILICSLYLFAAVSLAEARTLLFVPADNRPVSLEYAVDTVKAANFDILVPPEEYLAGRGRTGEPEQIWDWLNENAPKAEALVLSADTLIYGGLVDSRTHDFSDYVLNWRMRRFERLRQRNPQVRIYVFSTIMRSPHGTAGGVEPAYYETYGPDIFRLTALEDKAESAGLSPDEKQTLHSLQTTVPADYLADWLQRRNKNFRVNAKLVELAKGKAFDYLLIGRDDTSPYSQSHKESRLLEKMAAPLSSAAYGSFPGADQLGMVLLARAYNELNGSKPVVEIQYTLGAGPSTVASYEDQPVDRTLRDHIMAAGGLVARQSPHPDLVLAVNTPLSNRTPEAGVFENLPLHSEATNQFVLDIAKRLRAGEAVAVADIAFANGADNSFLKELYDQGLLDKLSAYSGWNTASNTLGYAIGQGMMARDMSDAARKRLLLVRYLDDWAYQANVRKEIYREMFSDEQRSPEYLNWHEAEVTALTDARIKAFARQYLWVDPAAINISFPWNRMFEIEVAIGKGEQDQEQGTDSKEK